MTAALVRHPFAPIAGPDAEALVLGTMPSPASLGVGWYYGHPRNAFWFIVGELYGAERALAPEFRAAKLVRNRVAVWDVLHQCERPGALDSDISSPVPNDFNAFLRAHPAVHTIVFNGRTAEALFMRLVHPTLGRRDLRYFTAPSTSPAHARDPQAKLAACRAVMEEALEPVRAPVCVQCGDAPSDRCRRELHPTGTVLA